MAVRGFKITLLALQAFWMLVVLPGHVRGMIVLGGGPDACCAKPAVRGCCATEQRPYKPGDTPSQDRQSRCAVCYQAHGYTVPPVYHFDLAPLGLLELCRLIEPTKLHRLLCEPTYFANGPPAAALLA